VSGTDDLVEIETTFSILAMRLFESGTVAGTLQQIVRLAEEGVDACDAAGIFVQKDGVPTAAAVSGLLAAQLDRLQLEAGEGPCIDATNTGSTFYAEDLADDDRWPTFAPAATEAGVRSILSFSLSAQRLSALNLYARMPAAFGAVDRAQGQLFATLARLALDSASEREEDEARVGELNEALKTRELIGQAQGILMERERITAEQAFDVLRKASQRLNLKLRDVAQSLVDTGEPP
jgi:hypothetical protein